MGRHCFVPFCNSGNRNSMKDGVKISFFTVPRNRELLNKWIINIRRADKVLDKKCYVCSKHFEEKYISREYVHIINGEEVRVHKSYATLSKDAIPTIFPNYPNSVSPSRKKIKTQKRAIKPPVLKKKGIESTNSHNQGPAISSCLKNEVRTNLLMPIGNSTRNSATDTEVWTNEETPTHGSTVSGQHSGINIRPNTAAALSNTNMKELKGNENRISFNSKILHQVTENEHLPKIPAVQTFFYPNNQKKYKGTQTKLTSCVILNQKAELKQLRAGLMKKHKDNEALRKKLQEKSEKLECFETNALIKNVAKMQALYNEGLANKQIEFTLDQISNFERKNPRWSDSVLRECVFLHATSPKGYEALRERELLRLPGRRTLYRFLQPTGIYNQDELSDTNFELNAINNQDDLSDTNFELNAINNQDELSDASFDLTTINNQDELSDSNFEL